MRSVTKLVLLASLGASTIALGIANAEPTDWQTWAVERGIANTESAGREDGAAAKAAKVVTGISVKDIKEQGLGGGENSVVRRPLGSVGKAIGLDIKLF
jgi:hypothetical protein